MEFGRDVLDEKLHPMGVPASYDFLCGIGLLNIFSFQDVDGYSKAVAYISSLIKKGGTGVWVTYDQPHSNMRQTSVNEVEPYRWSSTTFIRNGWKDVTNVATADLKTVGLDYRHGAHVRVFMYNR